VSRKDEGMNRARQSAHVLIAVTASFLAGAVVYLLTPDRAIFVWAQGAVSLVVSLWVVLALESRNNK